MTVADNSIRCPHCALRFADLAGLHRHHRLDHMPADQGPELATLLQTLTRPAAPPPVEDERDSAAGTAPGTPPAVGLDRASRVLLLVSVLLVVLLAALSVLVQP